VAAWFAATFPVPTACQREAWPAIRAGSATLVCAPTGSGKTLGAFLSAIDELVVRSTAGGEQELKQRLESGARVVWLRRCPTAIGERQ